ncbi:MAG TPA: thioesterase family protein [Polyangiales bacterium]
MPQIPADVTVSVHHVRVGYVDTDQGCVVHHGTYFRYLEHARVELLRERGVDYKHFERDNQLGLPVVDANIRYHQSARFDDLLEIKTWIAVANRAKVRFDSLIFREGTLLTHAQISLACTRLPEGRICSVPTVILDLADASLRGKRS